MQPIVIFALCVSALSRIKKFIDSIYYLHEKLNSIVKNIVSSSRSDQLQKHSNCEILTCKNKQYIWGVVNKDIYYSESPFSEAIPIVKNNTSTYDLTIPGYVLKDLYQIKDGWVGLWRKLTTTTPWRVIVYDSAFTPTATYDLTCDQYSLQGRIWTYNAPYIWITYSTTSSESGYTSGYFTKVNLTDSSITFEDRSIFQYYDSKQYSWFRKHVIIDGTVYYFDELSFNHRWLSSYIGAIKRPVMYDGTYVYILHAYGYNPDIIVAKKVV